MGIHQDLEGPSETPWRRKWQPTPVFLPGEFQGQRSLVGYSPWDYEESEMTECLTLSFHFLVGWGESGGRKRRDRDRKKRKEIMRKF